MGVNPPDAAFQQRVNRIEALVQRLEALADPRSRADAEALVQAVLELHAGGLARILQVVAQVSGAAAEPIVDRLTRDDLVSSLLLLHGLHPLSIQTRVERALETLPVELAGEARVELLSIDESGLVRLRLEATAGGCGDRALERLRRSLEEAISAAVPDAAAVVFEPLPADSAGSTWTFIPLDALLGATAPLSAVGEDVRGC